MPGYRIAQLAVRGSNPIPSLESLAHDPKFRGIVICSTTESQMADVSLVPGKGQYVYVDWFRRDSSLYRRLDRALAARVEEALVVRNPRLGFANIFQGVFGRSAGFGPSPRIMNFERSRLLDFEQVPRQQVKTWRNKQVLGWRTNLRRLPRPARAWLARARQLESGIERIQQRGGRVVIFHPPLVPESRTFTEQAVPREDYWDAFAAGSSALVIHALDVPGLADIDFPDGSHLDYRDRNKFTHALLDELERHGTFNGR
ncbi:MAG: hypothetical protein GWN58_48185 [Anaerolineae bacterium]|nr:hypothetical protein [Anaerolineae bacterium]